MRDGVAGPLDSGLQHRFQSPGAAVGVQQEKGWLEPMISPSLLSS